MAYLSIPAGAGVPIDCGAGGATVTNAGPATVYYRDEQPVDANANDGSLAAGASATLSGTQYLFVSSADAAGRSASVGVAAQPAGSGSGTYGARPNANTVPVGYLYFSTDKGRVSRSDSASWYDIGPFEAGRASKKTAQAGIAPGALTALTGLSYTDTFEARPYDFECQIYSKCATAGTSAILQILEDGVDICDGYALYSIASAEVITRFGVRKTPTAGAHTYSVSIFGIGAGNKDVDGTATTECYLKITAV